MVEDYDDARRFMKLLLETNGYQVIEAGDGIEALDKFNKENPDIVLMDISLPLLGRRIYLAASTKKIPKINWI